MQPLREKLTEMAQDPSTDARSKLLVSLSDLIFDHRIPTAEEVTSLCDVAKLLLAVVDDNARCHFAGTVAPNKHVSREVVFMLLADDLAVARPLLLKSPILTDTDLLAIARSEGEDRLVLIAQRDGLGTEVVEVLADRGTEPVQLAISENGGIRLSPKALELLVQTAKTSEQLCRSLVRRQELSKVDAEHLVQLITKMLMARMKATVGAEQAAVEPPVEEVKPKKPPRRMELAEILAALKAGKLDTEAAIVLLADEDRFNDLNVLISKLTNVDDVSVMRLLVRADANGIGMVMKALDVSEEGFASIIALRKRRLKTSDVQVRYERDDYAKLSLAESKATLSLLNGSRGRK